MPFEANDFQEKYLRAVFAFIGIGDIEIIRAEGLALSPAHRETALNTAHAIIPDTVAAARAAVGKYRRRRVERRCLPCLNSTLRSARVAAAIPRLYAHQFR